MFNACSGREESWFTEDLRPRDSVLRAWLRSTFPYEGDIVQEAYLKVMEAI